MSEATKGRWQSWLDRIGLKTLAQVLREYPSAIVEYARDAVRSLAKAVAVLIGTVLIAFSPVVWLTMLLGGSIRQAVLSAGSAIASWRRAHPRTSAVLTWLNRFICLLAWLWLAAFVYYAGAETYHGRLSPAEGAKVFGFFAVLAYLGVQLYRRK